MDKTQFNRYKKIAVCLLLSVSLTAGAVGHKKQQEQNGEIRFYGLPEENSVMMINTDADDVQEAVSSETDMILKEESEADCMTRININTADSRELQQLNRIGPVLAERIIQYRNSYGLYETIEEIKQVSGIGDATFEKLKDYITVDGH